MPPLPDGPVGFTIAGRLVYIDICRRRGVFSGVLLGWSGLYQVMILYELPKAEQKRPFTALFAVVVFLLLRTVAPQVTVKLFVSHRSLPYVF